jgi:hypothetical protein
MARLAGTRALVVMTLSKTPMPSARVSAAMPRIPAKHPHAELQILEKSHTHFNT